MKNIFLLLIFLIVCSTGCRMLKPSAERKAEKQQTQVSVTENPSSEVNFADQVTWLLGYFNPERLTNEPYSTWYIKGFDEYMPKSEAINKLFETSKENLTIKIVMGTWCPDSRREVPRFMRILDIWQFPPAAVTFIGVDNAKLSPVGEYSKLDIQFVPTFIFYKNNIEIGRIIENPKTSLEQDMVNILASNEK